MALIKSRQSSRFQYASFLCIALLIVFVPLMKGGHSEWVRTIVVVVAMLAFLFEVFNLNRDSRGVVWWVWVWVMLTLLTIIQIVPGVGIILSSLSANNCLQGVNCDRALVSGSIIDTLSYWAMFSAYWGVAWVVSQMSAKLAIKLAWFMVAMGVMQALYGLIAFESGQETILGIWEKVVYKDVATGSFVNRNHFSGFLELTWCLGLGVLLSAKSLRKNKVLRIGLQVCFSSLMVVGILASSSRLGILSALLGMMVLLFSIRRIKGTSPMADKEIKSILYALLGGLLVLTTLIWYGLGDLIKRMVHLSDEARYVVWTSLKAFPDSIWLFGVGAGNFLDSYKLIHDVSLQSGTFAELHSDVLEFVLNFGLLGTGLFTITLMVWFLKLKPINPPIIQVSAISAIIALFVHSLGDFNLQIPGVAILFWSIVGLMMNSNLTNLPTCRKVICH